MWSGSSNGTMPSPSAIVRAVSSASGVEPAIAQPMPRRSGVPPPAKVCSGWKPKTCAPPRAAGRSAASEVAPLVWPTRRALPATVSAAAVISASGTQSRITSAGGDLAATGGPSTS